VVGFVGVFIQPSPDDLIQGVVRMDPDLQGLAFGRWKMVQGHDRLGTPGTWLVNTLTFTGDKPLHPWDLEVTAYNEAGIKTTGGHISFPELKPGETGEVEVRVDNAFRVTVSARK
jgi:hypothetical protein